MIRHLFRLAWRRKTTGSLLILEILISFLVVFGLSLACVQVWSNYVTPVGYQWQDAWVVEIGVVRDSELKEAGTEAVLEQLLREIERTPQVYAAGLTTSAPYQQSRMVNSYESEGRVVRYEVTWATEGLATALGIVPVHGRWFTAADTALGYRPVVIDELLAAEFFSGEDPIGKDLPRGENETGPEQRIIGVIPSYRNGGDLATPENYLFEQVGGVDAGHEPLVPNIVLRLRQGVDPSFEEMLTRRLQAMAPRWSLEMRPMAHMRDSYLRNATAPLLIGGLVALFLMLMVGLGLTGVLWQNVTQRTREMGLRRAAGATTGNIRRQVVAEILILATMGIAVGVVIVVQLPILDLLGGLRGASFGGGLLTAIGIIYSLSAICALYPGWLATRVTPSEALHYE